MKELLIGTHNKHKTEEIARLLKDLPLAIKDLSRFPQIAPVEEDGDTLLENAVKKAKYYSEKTGLMTLADDTGLEVDALNGEPGVKSARYAGDHCSYQDNNLKLLQALSGAKNGDRTAHFKCVIACYDPKTKGLKTAEGKITGRILASPRGRNGFGYDPVFYMPELKKTLAELSMEEKNTVSHRALAVLKMKDILKTQCERS